MSTPTFTTVARAKRALTDAQADLERAEIALAAARATADPQATFAESTQDPLEAAVSAVRFAAELRDRCFVESEELQRIFFDAGVAAEEASARAGNTSFSTGTPAAPDVAKVFGELNRRLFVLEQAGGGGSRSSPSAGTSLDTARLVALENAAASFAHELSPLKRKLDALTSARAPVLVGYERVSAATAATMSSGPGAVASIDPVSGGKIRTADGIEFSGAFQKNVEEAMQRAARSLFAQRVLPVSFFRPLSINEQGVFLSVESVPQHVEFARQSSASPQMAVPGTESLWLGEDLIATPLYAKHAGGYPMIQRLYLGAFALNPTDDHTPFTLAVLPVAFFDPARERVMEFVRRLLRAWTTAFDTFFGARGSFSWALAFEPLQQRCIADTEFRYLEVDFIVDAIGTALSSWFAVVSRSMPVKPFSSNMYHYFGEETSRQLLRDFLAFPSDHTAVQNHRNRVRSSLSTVLLPGPALAHINPSPGLGNSSFSSTPPAPGASSALPSAPPDSTPDVQASYCLAAFIETIGRPAHPKWQHKFVSGSLLCTRKHATPSEVREHLESYFVPVIQLYYSGEDKAALITAARAFTTN